MVYRVYDNTQIDCTCIIEHEPVGLVRCAVEKLGSQEATVVVPFKLAAQQSLELILEFRSHSKSMVIPARVLTCENGKIEFRFEIFDAADALELEELLPKLAKKQYAERQEEIKRKLQDYKPQKAIAKKPPTKATSVKKKASASDSPIKQVKSTAKIPRLKTRDEFESPVRVDGQIDLKATVRKQAKTIPIKKLAEQHAHVQVLNIDTLERLAKRSADEALKLAQSKFSEKERQELLQESEKLFSDRLAEYQLEKQDLETRSKGLAEQLERAEALLAQEQMQVIHSDRFTVSDEGLLELDNRMQYLLDQAMGKGKIDQSAQGEMREVIANLLDGERSRIKEQAEQAQSESLKLLERKISRLSRSLEETKSERDSAKKQLFAIESQGNGPVVNIMEAGLDEDDPFKLDKLSILAELVEENEAIREHMKN